MKETFSFPASVQSDLFGYLKPHQQAILKPYLRIVKRPYQQKLCISLLDYLEGNGLDTLAEPVLYASNPFWGITLSPSRCWGFERS